MKKALRTVIFFGNCQALKMANCLQSIPSFCNKHEILLERNFDNPISPAKKVLIPSQINNCAFLMEQIGRKNLEFPHKELLPSDCVITRYPYLKLMCLWPFNCDDPRNKAELPKYPLGRFPRGDSLVIDMINNISEEILFDKYMKLNITDYVDLDQLLQSDLTRIREVDDKCDVKVYNFIREQFRTKKLFNIFSHPTDYFQKLVLLEILKKSGLIRKNLNESQALGTERKKLSESIVDGINRFFYHPRFDNFQVPIHPKVCKHYNLTWADSNTKYEYYDYGHLTFKEYMQIYINYAETKAEMIEKIKGLFDLEKFEEANILIERANRAYPSSSDLLNLQSELMLRIGNL